MTYHDDIVVRQNLDDIHIHNDSVLKDISNH